MEESKKSCFISDRVDYKGDPADRNTTGGWVPAALIVGEWIPQFDLLFFLPLRTNLFIFFSVSKYIFFVHGLYKWETSALSIIKQIETLVDRSQLQIRKNKKI
jgi:hypothetical protein